MILRDFLDNSILIWFWRQQFWRHTIMSFLINTAALLSFQIWLNWPVEYNYLRTQAWKDSRGTLPKPQTIENLAKSDYFGLLTSKVLMNTMNCGRCVICFEHIYNDWWPRFAKLVHSQWRWKFHCLASFNILVEAGFMLMGQCTNKSLIICNIMNLLATLQINAVHNIPESTWALN